MKFSHIFIYCLLNILPFAFAGYKKDALTAEEKSITGVKVYDDSSIQIPIQIVVGKGTLLSAY